MVRWSAHHTSRRLGMHVILWFPRQKGRSTRKCHMRNLHHCHVRVVLSKYSIFLALAVANTPQRDYFELDEGDKEEETTFQENNRKDFWNGDFISQKKKHFIFL